MAPRSRAPYLQATRLAFRSPRAGNLKGTCIDLQQFGSTREGESAKKSASFDLHPTHSPPHESCRYPSYIQNQDKTTTSSLHLSVRNSGFHLSKVGIFFHFLSSSPVVPLFTLKRPPPTSAGNDLASLT